MTQRILAQWEKRGWSLYERYERHIGAFSFLFGLIFDNLTLTRVDLWFDNIVFLVHLTVVAGAMILLHLAASGRVSRALPEGLAKYLPIAMQFSFGNLFSGFFVFYSRSGSLITSWPFLVFLALLLVGNEIFRKYYARFAFHASIFFITLFSYLIFALPVLFHRMGAGIFIASGIGSAILIALFLALVGRISPARLRPRLMPAIISIAALYGIFHLLYFTNILPPIPLSLKDIGVYHSVTWSPKGIYSFQYEEETAFLFWRRPSRIFHRRGEAPVYVYSAVFAPTDLRTKIFHRWSYYNKRTEEWTSTDTLSFSIVGGRDGGWRGFTLKERVFPGAWRVEVVTERGQLLGRTTFEVANTDEPPTLVSREE